MADLSIIVGSTSQSILVDLYILATGAGQTGLVYNSTGLTAYYSFAGTNATSTSITLATLAAVTSAYSSGGFKELDATNMPGVYRFDVPTAVLAASKGREVIITFNGYSGMAQRHIKIELTAVDNQSTGFGLVNASANVAQINAVSTSSVTAVNANIGTTQAITFDANNYQKVDLVDIAGTAVSATTAQLGVNVVNWNNTVVATPATAGIPDVNVKNINNAAASTPGASGGILIAGTNAATTIDALTLTGLAASGATPATAGLTITGGAASTTGGGTAAAAIIATGGAGAASTNGAASGATITAGGTNTVASVASGLVLTGASTGHGLKAISGAGATGDGINATSQATAGNGVTMTHNGSAVFDLNAQTTNALQVNATQVGSQTASAAGTVTFPGTIASATNITAGTITTVTNLTNAPTAGDFTSTMKTSIGTAVAASAVASVTAQVTANVTDWDGTAVGSIPPDAIFIHSGTAQAGGSSTITLDAGASATNNIYDNEVIFIRSGTGAGQSNIIASYVGSTQVATVSNAWATNPDNTSVFTIAAFGPVIASVSGTVTANVTEWLGSAVTAATSGIPDVNVKNINNVTAATPGASGGMLISGSNSGTTTLGALTCTGALTISDGISVTRSSSNAAAIFAQGSGTGYGLDVRSGNGATGDAVHFEATSTNGHGMHIVGSGTGNGIIMGGSDTGHGLYLEGGFTSGYGLYSWAANNGHGAAFVGSGSGNAGILCQGGTNGDGIETLGGGTGHGIFASSGTGATGDGIFAAAQSTNGDGLRCLGAGTGYDIDATTTLLTLAKTTNITGFNDIAATAIVSSGAITTSSGAVSTVTNLTNAPTAGDLTATMKTSVTTAVNAATTVGITSNRKKGASAVIDFPMTDSTTGADKTGLTVASVISKDGGAFASTSNAVTEIADGWYTVTLTATEMTANNVALQFTSTGATTRDIMLQTQP